MKNVLAFFGAFNPPTRAHVELADFAFRAAGREGVTSVPSRADHIRNDQGKDGVLSGETRLAMLEKIAETRPWMEVTDRELREPVQPRTYVTLCALRKDGFAPALLVGSDKLPELPRWKELQDRITLLDTPDSWRDISSSKVREALRQGRQEDLARMVPEEILPMLLPAL